MTVVSALRKIDRNYESMSEALKIPLWKTFFHVTVPLSLAAVLEVFIYFFVNTMVTVSAVVFLYSANFKVASIAIIHMEEAGDFAQVSAMGVIILGVNLLVRIGYEIICGKAQKLEAGKAADVISS